jgi:hypothetical protein
VPFVLILVFLAGFLFAGFGYSSGGSSSGPHKYAPVPQKCVKRSAADSSSHCPPPANP